MADLLGSDQAATDHEDLAFYRGTRQEVQRPVGHGDRPGHPPSYPERPTIQGQLAPEATAGGESHIALHARGP